MAGSALSPKNASPISDPMFPRIPGLLAEDDGEITYVIDAAASFDDLNFLGPLVSRFTYSRQSADDVVDVLTKRFACVRLYEWGRPRSKSGRATLKNGWIAFWWSDHDFLGQVPGDGMGIPDKRVHPMAYTPIGGYDIERAE